MNLKCIVCYQNATFVTWFFGGKIALKNLFFWLLPESVTHYSPLQCWVSTGCFSPYCQLHQVALLGSLVLLSPTPGCMLIAALCIPVPLYSSWSLASDCHGHLAFLVTCLKRLLAAEHLWMCKVLPFYLSSCILMLYIATVVVTDSVPDFGLVIPKFLPRPLYNIYL